MPAPRFVTAGTPATDAGGAWTFTGQNLSDTSLVIILQILQDGSTVSAVALTGVNGTRKNLAGTTSAMTQIVGPGADGSFPVGGSSEARQFLWIGRVASIGAGSYSGSNSTSEDLYIQEYAFADVVNATTLATVIENATAGNANNETGTTATASDTGVTSLGIDRLAVNFEAVNDDNTIAVFTGETGGDWSLATTPYAEASGTDGALALQTSLIFKYGNMGQASELPFGGDTVLQRELAQSFVAGETASLWWILSKIKIDPGSTNADDAIIEIQSNSGGVPSGTVLGSATIVGSSNITSDWKIFTVSISASLISGTTYWIVWRRNDAPNDGDTYLLSMLGSGTSGAQRDETGWTSGTIAASYGLVTDASGGGVVNGGSGSITDIDAWGVIGFALIGTSLIGPAAAPGPVWKRRHASRFLVRR